jgi:hypothetical protein
MPGLFVKKEDKVRILAGKDRGKTGRVLRVDPGKGRALVEGSSHGRYLRSLGPAFARDVAFCAVLDRFDRAFEV